MSSALYLLALFTLSIFIFISSDTEEAQSSEAIHFESQLSRGRLGVCTHAGYDWCHSPTLSWHQQGEAVGRGLSAHARAEAMGQRDRAEPLLASLGCTLAWIILPFQPCPLLGWGS